MTPFPWSKRTEEAALNLAMGELSVNAIAAAAEVTPQTVWNWRQHPEFAERVRENKERIREDVFRVGVAERINRVRSLNDRWGRLHRVIEARAGDPEMVAAPGGETGMLVRQTKKIGQGRDAETVVEFSVDTGLLSELRAIEKQAAQELGQWSEKTEVTGADGGPIKAEVNGRIRLVEVAVPALPPPDAPTDDAEPV